MKEVLSKKDLKQALKGQWHTEGKASVFSGIGTDTRKSLKGQVFFALKGPHFDGHDFLFEAQKKGAALLIASHQEKIQAFLESQPNTGLLQVEDTLKALQNLAVFWRKKLKLKLICFTGSSGKTTTKQFTQTLLSSEKVFSSPHSFNNHWGVPLSLLSAREQEAFFIQEIGASHKGEIAALTSLCDPFVAGVTSIGPAHLEGFGNMENLSLEKQQIYEKSPQAHWLFNEDNPFTQKMLKNLSAKREKKTSSTIFTFSGKNQKASVFLSILQEKRNEMDIEGMIDGVPGQAKVFFSGECQLENLMCACAAALACQINPKDIWQRIPKCQLPPGRQSWFEWKERQISILFDAYNANPLSMEVFLKQCHKSQTRKSRLSFILGDMKELGEKSEEHHKKLCQNPSLQSADFIWYVGEHGDIVETTLKATSFKGEFVKSKSYEKSLLLKLKKYLQPHDILGIKASRSLKLEQALLDLTGQKVF